MFVLVFRRRVGGLFASTFNFLSGVIDNAGTELLEIAERKARRTPQKRGREMTPEWHQTDKLPCGETRKSGYVSADDTLTPFKQEEAEALRAAEQEEDERARESADVMSRVRAEMVRQGIEVIQRLGVLRLRPRDCLVYMHPVWMSDQDRAMVTLGIESALKNAGVENASYMVMDGGAQIGVMRREEEPDTSDIPEVGQEWFERASLVWPTTQGGHSDRVAALHAEAKRMLNALRPFAAFAAPFLRHQAQASAESESRALAWGVQGRDSLSAGQFRALLTIYNEWAVHLGERVIEITSVEPGSETKAWGGHD